MSVTVYWRKYKSGNQSAFLLVNEGGKQQKIPLNIHIKKGEAVKGKKALVEKVRSKYQINRENNQYGFQADYKKDIDFIKYFEKFLKSYPRKDIQKVRNSLAKFKLFIKKKRLPFSSLSVSLCEKYMLYLQYDAGLSGETPYDYWKKFKAVIKSAKKEKIILSNPAEDITFKNRKSGNNQLRKNILTVDELKALYQTECKDESTKKVFLFACFTGLGYSEISKLTWSRIINNKLMIQRDKTGEQILNDLPPVALKMIGERGKARDKVFPKLSSNSMTARNLKTWCKKAGISKNISFYCGRHTFATQLLLNGANLKTVADCLGHSSTKHTVKYLNYVNSLKTDAIASLPTLED